MEEPRVTLATAPNGLRMVHRLVPGATEVCGVTVNAGSRDEVDPADFGLAHFVEHTIFKGTPRRTSSYILNRMEAVGGELNAFTTKEETTVYSSMPAGNRLRAERLIAELVTESAFPDRGINLEREVIADEIDSYLDSPSEAVYDLFDEMAYSGNPLAHNILGTKQTVADISSEQCRQWLRRAFAADNMVYFYLGPAPAKEVFRSAARNFAALPLHSSLPPRVAPVVCSPLVDVQDSGAHQSHTVMGVEVGGLHAPERFATALAVNLLGGPGMNALLNVELRERRGLVYTVEASTALYSDTGMTTIYFGCDHADCAKCTRLVQRTLDRMAQAPLSPCALAAARRQYLGQLTLGNDNKEQLALATGRSALHGLRPPSLPLTAEKLESITAQQLLEAAQRLASAPLRSLTLA